MLQRTILLSSALGVGVGARVLSPRQSSSSSSSSSSCTFHINTSGTISAPVGQYDSGQTRAGDGETPSSFTIINDNGGSGGTLTDAQNRGCWWTPPALVLQCDVGQIPEAGFAIGCDGTVEYNGQTTFYSCDTGADGLHMIYLAPNGSNCGEITLTADGCVPDSCGSSSPGATPTSSSPGGGSGAPGGGTCPGELTDTYQYPHLIIPVDSSNADSAPGTSYFGEVSSTLSSAFNFDIPALYAGKTCKVVFYFPEQSQLETSSYTFSGSGSVECARLSGPVAQDTSYASLPSVQQSYGTQTVAPGNGYTITSFECPAGDQVTLELSVAGDSDISLRYFQDYNPCPIGLFIIAS
ncbi:ubiquitin 3 binding protein But2 C-terminal domain-containing protein [Xylaria arbuscula]|nr:ubiquitin 3 binding protein But2 C-terminal domain-containing protein [Xylaria arbuscula]